MISVAHSQERKGLPLALKWGPFVSPEGAQAAVEEGAPPGVSSNAASWLHLRSEGEGTAGANSNPLPSLIGRVTFEYRAERAGPAHDNLKVFAIPLNGEGKEDGKAGRTAFTLPKESVGDGKVHTATLEYNYQGQQVAQVILAPRINEGGTSGPGEFWIGHVVEDRFPARLAVLRFGPEKSLFAEMARDDAPTGVQKSQEIRVHATVRNDGGEPADLNHLKLQTEGMVARIPSPKTSLAPTETAQVEWKVTSAHPGMIGLDLRWEEGKPQLLASEPLSDRIQPIKLEIPGRTVALQLYSDSSQAAVAARLRNERVVSPLGNWLFPLAAFTTEAGETIYFRGKPLEESGPSASRPIHLRQIGRTRGGAGYTLDTRFEPGKAAGEITAETTLTADQDLSLRRFAGPTLLVEPGLFPQRWAHFPGLEYLVGDQRSSENEGDPERLRMRFLPDPLKVTQPWMAVGKNGEAVGIAWDPDQVGLEDSSGERRGVQPLFLSPDFLSGQDCSRMSLSLPVVGEGLSENSRILLADRPFHLPKGQTLRLTARFFIEPVANAADAAALGWRLSPPAPLSISPVQREEAVRLSLRAFTEQLWVPEAQGWRMHLPLSYTELSRPAPSPDVARALWIAAQRLPEADPLRKAAEEQARIVINHALEGSNPLGLSVIEAAKALGLPTDLLLPRARLGLDEILSTQERDGSWRFHPDAAHQALGEENGTATGLIAGNAAALLRYAELSGDQATRAAGLKAVHFMEKLPRPEGSQVWEVPLHVPDLLAAAHATRAYLAAYRVTGDPHWRIRALEAAKSGLTFVYTWSAPDHPIMAYGTIPVYGTSWHSLPWFGLLVQWNGLAYAAEITPLASLDPTLPWKEVAEGITACALQLQRKPDQMMTGNYPDVWSVLTNQEPFPVPYISPMLILEALNALAAPEVLPQRPRTGPLGL
jgi:hypothetical protein